jgi:plastocyanin
MKFMKKVFFFTGLLFLLLGCSKDQSVTGINVSDNISAKGGNGKESPTIQNTVHILGSGFSPDSLIVNINSTVFWVNDDDKPHTVTSDKFDSGDILPGSTYKFYFDNTGHYHYYCKYHSEKAVIVVAGIR